MTDRAAAAFYLLREWRKRPARWRKWQQGGDND
jgi:hypothetical protein